MSDARKDQPVVKTNLRRSILPIAAAAFLVFAPANFIAHRSGDPKLDRAIEKANLEFVAAMKTGNATAIAAPYTDRAVFIAIDGTEPRTQDPTSLLFSKNVKLLARVVTR